MKYVYCSACGFQSEVRRKALPKYGTILDLIDPHRCTPEPRKLDLKEKEIPMPTDEVREPERKFENGLDAGRLSSTGTDDLRDRRLPQFIKPETSSAPRSVIEALKMGAPTKPEHEDTEPDSEPENE